MGKKRENLIDQLTEVLLISHGLDDEETDYEWDADNPDSQYSVIREDVALVITSLEQRGMLDI